MDCPQCTLSINCNDNLTVMCEGTCFRSFHAACVGLSESSVSCLQKNIIWLCDVCLAIFYEQHKQRSPVQLHNVDNRSQNDVNLVEELVDIKGKIANIMETLSTISEIQKKPIPCVPSHSTPTNSPTLPEISIGDNSNSNHSANNKLNLDTSSSASSTRNKNGTFSLFLTNIDSHVSEDDINIMVSRSLGVEDSGAISVKKLVPKWMPDDELDYISFKVRLDDKYKTVAFQAETWPSGITYREFVERPRSTWKPAG